jgi:5-methyltetrahydrofolate--homocysteine methyltransferase
MLDVNDFEVFDLGVDVAPARFIEAIEQQSPNVVALSGFLTLAFGSMKKTIEAIDEAGYRDKVKIMIGGGQVDEAILKYTGADSFGANAMAAVNLCRQWMAES